MPFSPGRLSEPSWSIEMKLNFGRKKKKKKRRNQKFWEVSIEKGKGNNCNSFGFFLLFIPLSYMENEILALLLRETPFDFACNYHKKSLEINVSVSRYLRTKKAREVNTWQYQILILCVPRALFPAALNPFVL